MNDYSRTYGLDANGNRQQVVQDGAVMLYQMDNALPEPADFQMDQYTVTPFGAEEHDHNGNLIFRDGPTGGTMFHYDYADRLVRVERAAGPGFFPVASFSYDALGRRHSKTIYPPAPATSLTTQFVHDPDEDCDDIIEFRQNGAVVATFILPEVDDEVLVAFTTAGTATYFHSDDLGNVLALTDEAGEVLERYDYDDFGVPSFLDAKGAPLIGSDGQPVAGSPLGNPFLFHGMFWDAETALYHDSGLGGVNPMYEPKTGRYLGRGHRDVGGYRAGAGAGEFTFAGNNPWSRRGASTRDPDSLVFNVLNPRRVMFNPKEYSVNKVIVRGWDPAKKEEIIGTLKSAPDSAFPICTTDVTGEIELEAGRGMSSVKNNPLYQESSLSGSNPLYQGKEKVYRPGKPVYGNITFESGVTNPKMHDTLMSVIGNIR